MNFRDYVSDSVSFFRSWTADPRGVSAISPSSDSLARLITQEIRPSDGPVLELGVGTGVFTRALLARGVREQDLILVENRVGFAGSLQVRYPKAVVMQMDAARLARQDLPEVAKVGSVVSGLPLLSLSTRKVMAILSGAFDYLRPMGSFYQFTYLPRCPVPRHLLDRLGLKATRIGSTALNLPPATVYRITRRQPFAAARRSLIPDAKPVFRSNALAQNRKEAALCARSLTPADAS